ncbi:unnamed protein product [Ectocarpus fasciculatus]
MAVLKAHKVHKTHNLLGRAGSGLGRRRGSGLDRYSSSDSLKHGDHNRACRIIVLLVLFVTVISTPNLFLGPNALFSVNISAREEYDNGARPGIRGLSAYPPNGSPPVATSHGPRPAERLGVANKNGGVDGAPGAGDLCLGMAVGISPAQLVTFAASFREFAPSADLFLFFEAPTSERFNDIIDTFMITPLEISRERLEPASLRKYHPSSARWIMIQRFLDVKGPEYERVLMVDVGQTFFQANPFDIIGDPGVYTFTDDMLIGKSQQHSTKIQDCLGASVLARLADKPAIHSGVSLGTSSLVVDYARQMSEVLSSAGFQACEKAGVDAGLHDYLLYSGGVQGVLRFDQSSGPVTDVPAGKFDMSGSRVTNLEGREVPIVYRYVENAVLTAEVFRRYIYWNQEDSIANPADKERAADGKTADRGKGIPAALPSTVQNCEQFALSEGVDLFKAKCDLTNARVGSLGDCCAACGGRAGCQAFSFDRDFGLCYMKNCDRPNTPGPSATAWSITSGIRMRKTAQ